MTGAVYAFIDGAAFDATLEELGPAFGATYRDIDWRALTRGTQRIFYFDALPQQKGGESAEVFGAKLKAKQEKFSLLKKVPGFHVREGHTRLRENSGRPMLQQKGVDVALAVEVLKHTYSENITVARLFLNDLDFFPLLEALTDTKVTSELFYRPGKTAPELIEAADTSEAFGHHFLVNGLHARFRSIFYLEALPSGFLDGSIEVASGSNKYGNKYTQIYIFKQI